MLRLVKTGGKPERLEPWCPHYFIVGLASGCSYTVSTEMAGVVERALDRWHSRRWITFVDLGGARIRVRRDQIVSFEQCSPDTRTLWRRINGEWDREDAIG